MSSKSRITLDEFIRTPSGKGSAVNSNSDIILQNYSKKFDLLSKVSYKIYMNRDGVYYIHFLIPSESLEGATYDLVLSFTPPKNKVGSLHNYSVKFFANDHAFIYTYAYAYKKHRLLIDFLEKKLSSISLTTKPGTRNPDNQLGITKSLYLAYITMNRHNLFDIKRIDQIRVVNNHPEPTITLAVRKYLDIDKEHKLIREKLMAAKHKNNSPEAGKLSILEPLHRINPVPKVKSVLKSTHIPGLKHIGSTKKVKRF